MLQANYDGDTLINNTWVQGVDIDNNKIASQTTINFNTSYSGEMESGSQWRATFNITNLLDREPAIVAGGGGQTLAATQDTLGRRYQLSLNMDF